MLVSLFLSRFPNLRRVRFQCYLFPIGGASFAASFPQLRLPCSCNFPPIHEGEQHRYRARPYSSGLYRLHAADITLWTHLNFSSCYPYCLVIGEVADDGSVLRTRCRSFYANDARRLAYWPF